MTARAPRGTQPHTHEATTARRAADESPAAIPWPVWRLAWVIVFGAFMGGLDASLTNVGLDTMRADLGTDLATIQWVSTGYLVAFAASLPLCAWFTRTYGAGRVWLVSLAAFTVASGLCAAAWNAESLIALRAVQGLAAGLLIPAGQTVLGQAVGPARLGRVMSTLGLAVTLAPALGPVAGGLLLDVLPWQWLFLINLPLGVAAVWLGLAFVPRGVPEPPRQLDVGGFLLIGGGLPLLLFALTEAGRLGSVLRPGVVLPLAVGVIGLVWFCVRSSRRTSPLMDLRLYADRTYAAASLTAAAAGAVMFGSALLFPLYFQILRGQSPFETGISLLPLGVGTAATVLLAGSLTDRYGGGVVSVVGTGLTVAATVPFVLIDATASSRLVLVLLVAFGAAVALAAVPSGVAAYQAVSPERLPDATTQVNIAMRVGGALGGAALAVVLAARLPGGAEAAFRTTFGCLVGFCLLGLAAAGRLWWTLRHDGAER